MSNKINRYQASTGYNKGIHADLKSLAAFGPGDARRYPTENRGNPMSPSGEGPPRKTASINLQEGRPVGACSWELPIWGHPLSMGVFPLLAAGDIPQNPRLVPMGSAFCISRLGIVATAEHNIRESLKYHSRGARLRQRDELPESYELNDMGLAVFHQCRTGENTFIGNVWPLEGIQGAQPTDVVYGFPKFQTRFPLINFPVSFAVPRIGSRITCFGYTDVSFPEDGISVESLKAGRITWPEVYSHSFRAIEGRVTRIFTQRFANGFIRGPCITIDAEVEHGMSGGPAFNEQGHVCGVISAGASAFFDAPASIVSLLYPTLLTEIEFGASMGPVRINAKRPIVDLVAQGAIQTDGSESLVTIVPEQEGPVIGPMIHKEDSSFVHSDFEGYQAGEEASKETREVYWVRREV